MQSLQAKASEWSGVDSADAFAIDEINLFQKLGLEAFVNLSTNFYNRFVSFRLLWLWPELVTEFTIKPSLSRVYDDDQEWFRSIFANSKKEDAIQNQYEFFAQRMGGPPLYSQRRGANFLVLISSVYSNCWERLKFYLVNLWSGLGHPALIGRHRPFPVTHQAAERWLHHMEQALDSSSDIDADSKRKMFNFFRHTAFFLVAGDELKKTQTQNQPQTQQQQ